MAQAHKYNADYFRQRERSPTFRLEVAAFQRQLRRTADHSGPILEAGAGSGALALQLVGSGADVVAADIDVDPLNHLQGRGANVLRCDVAQLPVASGAIGAVVAQHVIEHFAEPVAVLREWRRVLRPGGACVVTTPNRNFPDQSWFEDPTHADLFNVERLCATFVDAGFVRITVRPLVPWLGSMRAVFMSARIQRYLLAIPFASHRSLNLLATGYAPDRT